MTITGKYVYVLVQEIKRESGPAEVLLFADALDAIRDARPRCDDTQIEYMTAETDAEAVVFRGTTKDYASVRVTRQVIA